MKRIYAKKKSDINIYNLRKHAPYLAGLFDGEGTFTVTHQKKSPLRFQPLISIAMSHQKTIDFVANVLGVDHFSVERKGRRVMFVARVTTRKEAMRVSESLRPYLITKKEQAECLLEFLSLPDLVEHKEKREEIFLKQAEIYIRLRKLNQRGSKAVNHDEMRENLYSDIQKALSRREN